MRNRFVKMRYLQAPFDYEAMAAHEYLVATALHLLWGNVACPLLCSICTHRHSTSFIGYAADERCFSTCTKAASETVLTTNVSWQGVSCQKCRGWVACHVAFSRVACLLWAPSVPLLRKSWCLCPLHVLKCLKNAPAALGAE